MFIMHRLEKVGKFVNKRFIELLFGSSYISSTLNLYLKNDFTPYSVFLNSMIFFGMYTVSKGLYSLGHENKKQNDVNLP